MTGNPLTALPAKVRTYIYLTLGIVVLAEGAAAAAYGLAPDGIPQWLKLVTVVTAYVSGAVGFTAASNMGTAGEHTASTALADLHALHGTTDAKVSAVLDSVAAVQADVAAVKDSVAASSAPALAPVKTAASRRAHTKKAAPSA